MKTFYSLFFICLFYSLSAQIVITEISYNPPESGIDSLEYIEIYNAGVTAYDLTAASFSDGVEFIFPDTLIEAETHMCIAINAQAMENVFGKTCFQWTLGALRNGGELIRLIDANSGELDAVEYGNASPWPSSSEGTNGNGASIVLCDVTADNSVGENWSAAKNNVGVEIDGKMVKGSPSEDNLISCEVIPDYVIEALPTNEFAPADITINPGETIRWINSGGSHNVNGDKATFPDNPESFSNGAPSAAAWTYDQTFFIEGVYQYQCDPHAGLGMSGTITVGTPKTFPAYDIGVLRTVNAAGIPDSIGKSCEITGTVHGINLSSSGGLLFFLIDESHDGISIFNPNNTLGYTVNEGDEITVRGTVDQFNGLTQFNAESVIFNGPGSIQSPITVDSIFEDNEAKLVILENFNYVDATQWRGDGSSFNFQISNGEYEATVRISEFTDLANMTAPQAPFSVVGLVNQFDFNEPYLESYQLLPRSSTDFMALSNTTSLSTEQIKVSPNPTSGVINIEGITKADEIRLHSLDGRLIKLWSSPSNQITFETESGIYVIAIQKENEIFFKKIIVTN